MPTAIIEAMGEPLQLNLDPGVSYRSIPGFVGYAVGDDGSVWSKKRRGVWKRRKASRWPEKPGTMSYPFISLSKDRNRFLCYVHRLVLTVFRGPAPPQLEARHLNGNYLQCNLDNLAWGTIQQNTLDKIEHGTSPIGELNGRANVTEEIVRQIRHRRAAGETLQSLVRYFGLPKATVSHIYRRYTWKHVD